MKDKWWQQKAAELEQHWDVHNFKRFFEGLKTVYDPSSNAMAPVPSSDGPCLQGSLISFKVGVKSLANFSTDRPVSHPRYASAPGSKLSWRSPNSEGNPEIKISSSRLGKHLLLMRYLQKSLRREERSSPSSSLSWCSSFGSRAQCLGTSRTPTPSTCTRTKMTEHPVTTTVQRHLAVEYSRKDHGTHHTKLYHTPSPGWFSSPRVSVPSGETEGQST